jgi:hypothetical protein
MDRDSSRRNEKRSKHVHDPGYRHIRSLVAQEFAGSSGGLQQGGGRGRGGQKATPRRGTGGSQASGSGADHGIAGPARQGEGIVDDGGREGKTIPVVGAPETPPLLLEYDPSYLRQFQGSPVRREPVIYNRAVQ